MDSLLDFGSFVSPKTFPSNARHCKVLAGIDINDKTDLLAIIANEESAKDAVTNQAIKFLGYPFSISGTFSIKKYQLYY